MSVVIHARVVEQLTRLRLRYVADRLDAVLNEAARTEPTYLDFLDGVLRQEVDAKQRTRVARIMWSLWWIALLALVGYFASRVPLMWWLWWFTLLGFGRFAWQTLHVP